MKYFLLAFGLGSFENIPPEKAGDQLRLTVDQAFAAIGGAMPEDFLVSVGPDIIMLAIPDANPSRAVQLLESVQNVMEGKQRSHKRMPSLRATLIFGDLRIVDVLGTGFNFEGVPAIVAARILSNVIDGAVAVEESAWDFSELRPYLDQDLVVKGKHPNESYNVRLHKNIKFPASTIRSRAAALLSDSDEEAQVSAVVKLAQAMLQSPLRDYPKVLFGPHGWRDSVEWLLSSHDELEYDSNFSQSRADFIRYLLGHIVVNPHDEIATDALLSTYVTAVEASPTNEMIDDNFINKSPATEDAFIDEQIKRARSARSRLKKDGRGVDAGRSDMGDRGLIVVVHGERGVGKTFLLNHLLTKYTGKFDDERVLWVRLNIAEEFGTIFQKGFGNNLVHRFLAQIAKVVLRYYDPDSDWYKRGRPKPYPLLLRPQLRDFIDKSPHIPNRDRRFFATKLSYMMYAFGTEGVDPAIRPELVPEIIGNELLRLVLANEYSVICVLDGLDRIEASAYHKRLFKMLANAAARLTSSQGTLGVAVVLVTRTNTLRTFPEVLGPANPFTIGEPRVWRVFPVPLDAIKKERMKFISDRVPRYAASTGWQTADWPIHLERFLGDIESRFAEDRIGGDFSVFGNNNRAKTQILQLLYYDFLRETADQPYLFTESLVLAGRRFPPGMYQYELTDKGNWREKYIGGGAFDNHLLPSIFRFPYVESGASTHGAPNVPHPGGVLWGLRILQLIQASDALGKSDSISGRLTSKELANILQRLFGYDSRLTMYLIDEMTQGELISAGTYDSEIHRAIENKQLFLLPKGQYVLRHFIYDIAYLNLCSMRIPIAISSKQGKPTFFIPASLKVRIKPDPAWTLNVGERLVRWVAAKIINGIQLTRLACMVNADQKDGLQTRLKALRPEWQRVVRQAIGTGSGSEPEGMFQVPEAMQKHILGQIRGMLQKMGEADLGAVDVIKHQMEKYWSHWR